MDTRLQDFPAAHQLDHSLLISSRSRSRSLRGLDLLVPFPEVALEPVKPTRSQERVGKPCKNWKGIWQLSGSILAGLLIGIGWLDENLGPIGLIGLGLFLWVQSSRLKLPTAIGLSLASGIVAYSVATFWIQDTIKYLTDFDSVTCLLLSLVTMFILALKYVCFAAAWWAVRCYLPKSYWISAPAILVFVEQLFDIPFPSHTGVLLSGYPCAIQLAEWGGVHLVSMYAITLAGFIGWNLRMLSNYVRGIPQSIHLAHRLIAAGLIALPLVWGSFQVSRLESQTNEAGLASPALDIGLVQADTELYETHARMIETSREMEGKVDLVVWPECSLGEYDSSLREFSDPFTVYEKSRGDLTRYQPFPDPVAPLLAGGGIWESDRAGTPWKVHYVSALLFDERETLVGRHDKNQLMALGEEVPGTKHFPSIRTRLSKWLGTDEMITASMVNQPIGEIDGVRIGALLCCEDMSPRMARQQVAQGATVLFTLGNGMCFDSAVAVTQHYRIAKFRAIENRVPLVRCCSKGISGQVHPSGTLSSRIPAMADESRIIRAVAANGQRSTLYTTLGEFVPNGLAVLMLLVAVGASIGDPSQKRLSS